MVVVATQNFMGVERLLEAPAPDAARMIDKLGQDAARMFLRYQVSELNRFYFDWYGVLQICLGILLALTVLFATNGNKFMLGLTLILTAVVIFEKVMLTPEITYLGRTIDFIARDVPSPARQRFWSFHTAFSTTEIVKMALMAVVGIRMLVSTGQRRLRTRSTDVLEDALSVHD